MENNTNIQTITVGEDWGPFEIIGILYNAGVATKPVKIGVIWDPSRYISECYTPRHESVYTNEQWAKLTSRQQAEHIGGLIVDNVEFLLGEAEEEYQVNDPTVKYELENKEAYTNLWVIFTPAK